MRLLAGVVAAMVCTWLLGCAAPVRHQPVHLEPASAADAEQRWTSPQRTVYRLTGFDRPLAAGAEYAPAGRIPQGQVLRPTLTAVMVNGRYVHEAYPVARDGLLVGFFLPVEQGFSGLNTPVPFPLQPRKP